MKKRKFKKIQQFNCRVSDEQIRALEKKRDDTGMSISVIVRRVLEESKIIPPSVELFS